jgi:hypothetical protein
VPKKKKREREKIKRQRYLFYLFEDRMTKV